MQNFNYCTIFVQHNKMQRGEKKLRKTRVFLSFVFSLKPLIIQLLCDTTTLIPCVLVWLQGYAL